MDLDYAIGFASVDLQIHQARLALMEARNFIGPHHIRSCGKCARCGKTTPNGTLLICQTCVLAEIDQALENLLQL